MKKIQLRELSGILLVMIILSSCAGTGGLAGNAGNERTYSQDYQSMKSIVEKVIRGNSLNIDRVSEDKNAKEMTLIISTSKYTNNQSVRQNQGIVTVKFVDEQETAVQVENPEYHFSVPDHQRENYQRMIFSRLEKYL